MKRGEIYYINEARGINGSEQQAGRPAVIVSNDKCNQHSGVIEVVYLTTKEKTELPTHVNITSAPRPSVALCEAIYSVSVEQFGDYAGTVSPEEMADIDNALMISLGLSRTPAAPREETGRMHEQLRLYKDLNERLLEYVGRM